MKIRRSVWSMIFLMRMTARSKCKAMFNRNKIYRLPGLFSYCLLALGLPILCVYRSISIWRLVSQHTGSSEPVYWSVLHQDAIVIGIVLLLLYLGFFNPFFRRLQPLSYLPRICAAFIGLAYTMDVWMTLNFYTRLYYRNILKYGQEFKNGLSLLAGFLPDWLYWIPPGILVILAGLCLFFMFFVFLRFQFKQRFSPLHGRILFVLGFCLLLLSLTPIKRINRPGALYQNLFSFNLPKGVDKPYTEVFIRNLQQSAPPTEKHIAGLASTPDIIVLIVESLSASHSRYFSGIHNYTPHFDAIARDNISLINFFANGPATEHGLIALLLGEVPLPGVMLDNNQAFTCFYREKSLATFMNLAGYTSLFLSTGDLSFTNKQDWLEHIGFQIIEGHKTPFYKKLPRYHFRAAPDQALYDYALKKLAALKLTQTPYFMVLETVSSHLPYTNPVGGPRTEKAIFNYVDRELGRFYQRLQKADFFDDGILIIVGDHRVMAPLSSAEYDRFGKSAFARIPLVVASGGKKRRRIEVPFQQTDLISSLEYLVSDSYRLGEWHGNFFHEPPIAPACILVPLTNDPDLVYAQCGNTIGYIKLDGDNTRLDKGNIAAPVLPKLLDHINRARIALCPPSKASK